MSTRLIAKENSEIEVSVIISTHNQPETVRLALRSLLSQSFQGSYEIIVSDDGSHPRLFSDCHGDFDKAQIPVKYVWQQQRGFRQSESLNNGIRIAKGKVLIFLNGDMVPTSDFIDQHVKAHERPKLLIAGNRYWRNLEEVRDRIDELPISKLLECLRTQEPLDEKTRYRQSKEMKRRNDWLSSPRPWRACLDCNLSVRSAPEVHFDEAFVGWGPNDWELAYRLCEIHGYTPVYKEEIVAYHLEIPEGAGSIFKRGGKHEEVVEFLRSMFYFYDRCPGFDLEEVFYSFPKLFLDRSTNEWRVRPEPDSYDLAEIVREARQWLRENNIYP